MKLCAILNVPKSQVKYKMLAVVYSAGILRRAMQCNSAQYRRVKYELKK